MMNAKINHERLRVRHLWIFLLLFIGGGAQAEIDLNGNGVSDLWERIYLDVSDKSVDSDLDGLSDFQEGLAGTDPFNAASQFRAKLMIQEDPSDVFTLNFSIVRGKRYHAEVLDTLTGEWQATGDSFDSLSEGQHNFNVTGDEQVQIFRVVCRNLDDDGDGLSKWEELNFGWSDEDMRSNGESIGLDFAAALKKLEGSGEVELASGLSATKRFPTVEEASRLLTQASFGTTSASLQEVQNLGLTGWIANQKSLPASQTNAIMQQNQQIYDAFLWRKGWWRSAMISPDQLRLRMAYALSQIFVIEADTGSLVGDNPFTQARYYDLMITGSFGPYRDILEDVTYSPAMGLYLSHFRNRKADSSVNRFPDENFAREIMQLFSIGLWELDESGQQILGEDQLPIATYDNTVITETAKVFTGLSNGTYGRGIINDDIDGDDDDANDGFFAGVTGDDFVRRMIMFREEHETDSKTIIGGQILPANQTGDKDISDTLDALANHNNTAPFISRLLIQRFTSSNPTPNYIRRVVEVWNDNGVGVKGDLGAVVQAILLDPEARNISYKDEGRGKVREPLLRLASLLRAFNASGANGTYPMYSTVSTMRGKLGQFALLAPTVFNFYSPDYIPSGELRSRGLFSPELELGTVTRLLETDNLLRAAIEIDFFNATMDFTEILPFAEEDGMLLDKLDELMMRGQMSAQTKQIILDAIGVESTALKKIRVAIHLLAESPEFVVLR